MGAERKSEELAIVWPVMGGEAEDVAAHLVEVCVM